MVVTRLSRFLQSAMKARETPEAPQALSTNAGTPRLASPYQIAFNACFVVFSSTRLLTYLPAPWPIHRSGDSSQQTLITWAAWVCSNAVMAAWLYENNGRRAPRAIVVTAGNALMCGAACVLIVRYR